MMKYKIDKNKNIGNVIFVVEGGTLETGGTELKLLKAVFANVLGYEVQELRRGSDEFIGHGKSKFSRVFALNLPKNQLTQLTEEALNMLFRRVREEFKIKPEDCPMFFLYDRDYLSYKANELRGRYVCKYTDPYSNDSGDQGQLLLSYPSVESYLLSCVNTDVFKRRYYLGKDIKPDVISQGISVETIKSDTEILNALEEMNKGLLSFGIDTYNLDDLGSTLLRVYDAQQATVCAEDAFSALSLISMALLELGIIVEDD